MVGAIVASQQHGPHGIIVEHVDNLLQRGGNKDANVLFDDQVVNPSQLGSLGAILRMLDGMPLFDRTTCQQRRGPWSAQIA